MRKFIASVVIVLLELLAVEGLLRLALFTPYLPIAALKNPAHYFDSSDPELWRVNMLVDTTYFPNKEKVHPLLGFVTEEVTAANPLGLDPVALRQLASKKPAIQFYGASFVKGRASPEFQLPRYLDARMKEQTVADVSVGGYGIDQVYLLFKEVLKSARPKAVILGMNIGDLDRSLLSIRTYQKPLFVLSQDGLKLTNVPIEMEPAAFLKAEAPRSSCYLCALLSRFAGRFVPSLRERQEHRAEVEAINTKLLGEIKKEADAVGASVYAVVFYPSSSLAKPGSWKESFLKGAYDRLSIPYFDTRPTLLAYADSAHVDVSAFYVESHHNDLANRLIGDGLLRFLAEKNLK